MYVLSNEAIFVANLCLPDKYIAVPWMVGMVSKFIMLPEIVVPFFGEQVI